MQNASTQATAPPGPALTPAAPMQVVVFTLGNETYGLPVGQVREVLRLQPITPLPTAPPFVPGMIQLRGRMIAVVDLRRRFQMPSASEEGKQASRIVVVRLPRSFVGLIVDGVQEVLTLPAGAIQPVPEAVPIALGRQYLLGIGRMEAKVMVLLDLAAFFAQESALWQGY